MRSAVAALLFSGVMIAAPAADAKQWTCRADSKTAFGWGKNETEANARKRALWECAKRTSRYRACRITSCKAG